MYSFFDFASIASFYIMFIFVGIGYRNYRFTFNKEHNEKVADEAVGWIGLMTSI